MSRFVADERTIINPQGIRWAEKRDRAWLNNSATKFYLFVQYKGESMEHEYPDKASRDAQFAALSAVLTNQHKRVGVDGGNVKSSETVGTE